jgi:predicted ATP-grasp superfamily ATP-dependent carboligase
MEVAEADMTLPLIIHDLQDSQMFALAQAAGRAGIPVEGTCWPMEEWAEKSRYVQRAIELPCLGDGLRGSYALQLKNQGLVGVWLPCVDDMADFTAQYQKMLRSIGMRFVSVDSETIRQAFATDQLPQVATLKVAPTTIVRAGDLYEHAETYDYPMMMKSVRNGFRKLSDASDLRQFFESQGFHERADQQHRIQKFIEGGIEKMASAVILFDEESRPVRGFTGRRLRVEETDFGPFGETTAARAEWIPELYEGARDLLAAMNWKGFAEVECKQDSDGQWYVMEVNPRLSGWSSLAEADGAGLLSAYYQMCADGIRLDEACLQRSKSEYVRVIGTCYHNPDWAVEREGNHSLYSQLSSLVASIRACRKKSPDMLAGAWDALDLAASISIFQSTIKRYRQLRKFRRAETR